MNKTLRISFSLRNTYRVNGILYSLRQLPLVRRLIPASLYRVRGLKIFANVLSVLWEILSVFLGKFLYFITMVAGIGILYEKLPEGQVYLHILLFLTVIGAFMNTSLFNPTRDKYYAVILLRMDAREYTLVNYGYSILKVIVGFLPFSLWFGLQRGVPLWFCLALPFSVAGIKLAFSAWKLRKYERLGVAYNENVLGKYLWLATGLLLAAAYGLPAAGAVLPGEISMAVMTAFIPAGILSLRKILTFSFYREVNQELLSQMMRQLDSVKPEQLSRQQSRKAIAEDARITSGRKGFEYLNELFIRRHRKILWKSSERVAAVALFLVLGVLLALYLRPELKKPANELLGMSLPYFTFIMYCVNRGTGFTQALFMNCDHSLLTYSFFKRPEMILKLFRIRLREIIKINLLPALVIGAGLDVLLFASGGTGNPFDYLVLLVSVCGMSVFFSIHYLTIYYLLQPYTVGTEMKSAAYRLILTGTYLLCFFLMQLEMDIRLFGALCILFCVLYSVLTCTLVYRFAPRTFRLRM